MKVLKQATQQLLMTNYPRKQQILKLKTKLNRLLQPIQQLAMNITSLVIGVGETEDEVTIFEIYSMGDIANLGLFQYTGPKFIFLFGTILMRHSKLNIS